MRRKAAKTPKFTRLYRRLGQPLSDWYGLSCSGLTRPSHCFSSLKRNVIIHVVKAARRTGCRRWRGSAAVGRCSGSGCRCTLAIIIRGRAVKAIVVELGASGPGDMGKVMGAVKQRLAGQADMGLVSAAVKAALAG